MSVVQAALLGLTAILFAAQLKPLKPEYAVYLVLAGIHRDRISGTCKARSPSRDFAGRSETGSGSGMCI